MPRIEDIGVFNAVREAGLNKLVPPVPRVGIGWGTCGRGNGAEGLYHAFLEAIERSGTDFYLTGVGCFGACYQEPLVNLRVPGQPLLILRQVPIQPRENVAGLIEANPELARAGIELRKFGLQVIESLAEERVHPSWIVPGGVKTPTLPQTRDRLLGGIPAAIETTQLALSIFKGKLDEFREEIENFGSAPTMYAGLVDGAGNLQIYDGLLRFRDAAGEILQDGIQPDEYADFIGEATLRESYLKAPYYKPIGYPEGIYRVGPLGRINVANACGTPVADGELQEFRQRFGRVPHSAFLYHHARLIEVLYALERMNTLLNDPQILSSHVRATANVNALEGVGIIEAPRGTLIHHYKVDENGAIVWANLIVATGHNNVAIGKSIRQVSEHFVKGAHLEEGMLNRVSAVVRAYDPCLSCSTHALGMPAVSITLLAADGTLLGRDSNLDGRPRNANEGPGFVHKSYSAVRRSRS